MKTEAEGMSLHRHKEQTHTRQTQALNIYSNC
jgi:hypothetical protein